MTDGHHGVRNLHEEATCRRFLDAYNASHGTTITFASLQAQGRPDCLCSTGLEIELVSAYYDPAAAKERWDLARGKTKPPTAPRGIENPDQTIFDEIDRAVRTKAGKHYTSSTKPWLVIRIDAPLLEWEDLASSYLSKARGLPQGDFDQVWVLLNDNEGDHVGQVTL
jgi:hypothetical protein